MTAPGVTVYYKSSCLFVVKLPGQAGGFPRILNNTIPRRSAATGESAT
jgi:hypothetical protein